MGAIISFVFFLLIYLLFRSNNDNSYYESGQNRGRSIGRKLGR